MRNNLVEPLELLQAAGAEQLQTLKSGDDIRNVELASGITVPAFAAAPAAASGGAVASVRSASFRHKEPTIHGKALFLKSGRLTPGETRRIVADVWGLPPPNLVVSLDAGSGHPRTLANPLLIDRAITGANFERWCGGGGATVTLLRSAAKNRERAILAAITFPTRQLRSALKPDGSDAHYISSCDSSFSARFEQSAQQVRQHAARDGKLAAAARNGGGKEDDDNGGGGGTAIGAGGDDGTGGAGGGKELDVVNDLLFQKLTGASHFSLFIPAPTQRGSHRHIHEKSCGHRFALLLVTFKLLFLIITFHTVE